MRRRDFLALAGAAAAALPQVAFAQQTGRIPRIIYLFRPTAMDAAYQQAFLQGLAGVGYVDGKNIAIDYLIAPDDAAMPAYAARAVASKPDLIVAFSSPSNVALKALGTTIPVVFTAIQDPVAIGVVDSYDHPGGNATGTMLGSPDVIGKQFEILREIVPSVSRMAFLGQPDDPPYAINVAQAMAAAQKLGIDLSVIDIKEGGEFVGPFEQVVKAGAEAVFVIGVTYFNVNMAAIADLAIKHRLPTVGRNNQAEMGLLVGYGSNNNDVVRRTGPYIAAILKGAKPGDLPIEQPQVFDFVINMKTAKALGITFPPSVMLRATEVIEA